MELNNKIPYIKDKYGQIYPDWKNILNEDIYIGEGVYAIKFFEELIYIGTSCKIRNRIKRHFFSIIHLSYYIHSLNHYHLQVNLE